MSPAPYAERGTGTARGLVPLQARGELVFHLLHGEPLFVHALRALGRVVPEPVVSAEPPDTARVRAAVDHARLRARVVSADHWWPVVSRTEPLLVHDPLCPLVTVDFLAEVRDRATERPGVSVVAHRPVTDTVKTAPHGRIMGTIDRDRLAAVTSPAVVSVEALASCTSAQPPPVDHLGGTVAWLRERGPVELVLAPALARRVDDASAVRLLECVEELSRSTLPGGRDPARLRGAPGSTALGRA